MDFALRAAMTWEETFRMFNRVLYRVCTLSVVALLLSHTARAETVPSVVFVIDGSGSMWGGLPGGKGSKVKVAASTLQNTLKKLKPKPNIGMIVFGQKSPGGCNASETLLNVGPYDENLFSSAAKRLNPKGRGPLVLGLNKAGALLENSKPPRNIVIIHDNPDNCKQDMCAAITALKKRLPDLKTYTVSLALKKAEKNAMACLADISGGRVMNVATINEITPAISAVIEEINKNQRASPGTPNAAGSETERNMLASLQEQPQRKRAVPKTPGLMLQAVLNENGPILRNGLIWKIIDLNEKTEPVVARTTASEPSIALQPGPYAVVLRTAGMVRRQEIEVKDGLRTVAPLHLKAAAVALSAVLVDDGPIIEDAQFMISKLDNSGPENIIWLGLAPPVPLILEPGEYKLVVSAGHARQSHSFSVSPGQKINLKVPLKAGYLNVNTRELEQSQSFQKVVVSVRTEKPGMPSGRHVVARSLQANPNFLLAPGAYYISADGSQSTNEELVDVTAGKRIEHTLTLLQMRLQITSRFKGTETIIDKNAHYRIWSKDTNDMPPLTSSKAAPEFTIAPGQYQIETRIGEQNAVIIRNFEITPAPSGRMTLNIDAGMVTLKAGETDQDIFWKVADTAGQTIWQALETEPKLTLKSGRYKVSAEINDQIVTHDITVESGRHIDLDISR